MVVLAERPPLAQLLPLPLLLLLLLLLLLSAPGSQAGAIPSKCPSQCSEFGTCNEELGRCDCLRPYVGDDCSVLLEGDELYDYCKKLSYSVKELSKLSQPCVNGCNGEARGACVKGICHCKPGYYGGDCSLSLDTKGKPVLMAGSGYRTREKGPRIYVYELPPFLNTAINKRTLDRPLYLLFWQRMLSSGIRVATPEEADWFFIPISMRTKADNEVLEQAVVYIAQTWPFWNRSSGADHFALHTSDYGPSYVRGYAAELTSNMVWMTHWGLYKDNPLAPWKQALVLDKDVVIPTFVSHKLFSDLKLKASPQHPMATHMPPRTRRLFFAGRICGSRDDPLTNGEWPNCPGALQGYSGQIRQRVHLYHHNRSDFLITQKAPINESPLTSQFCLSPPGSGFDSHQIIASFKGCVPVSVGNSIYQPFEPQMDWGKFSVHVRESEIPDIHNIIQQVFDEGRLEGMQMHLRCAAQHLAYSSISGSFMGESGKFDAFETAMQILRMKKKYPKAMPFEYVDLDPDFRAFMACQDRPSSGGVEEEEEELGGGGREIVWQPSPLCSQSSLGAGREAQCGDCASAHKRAKGFSVPGGFICCGIHDVASCPRLWQ